jgi:Ca-activated chloride channel homolog
MKSIKHLFCVALLSIWAAGLAAAQDDPVKVETNLVTVNVAVTDRKGNQVRGLGKDDFALLDGGQKRDIEAVFSENAPLSVGIVYDMHTTVGQKSEDVLKALKKFTSELKPEDDYFVSVFNERGTLTTQFVPDAEQIERQLSGPNAGSPNSLYDAIFDAGSRVGKLRNSKRILLVLTDGADHSSDHNLKSLKAHLRSVNLPVYALTFNNSNRREYGYMDVFKDGPRQSFGIGDSTALDRGIVAEIAKSTGGQAYENNIRNQYYLSALVQKVLDEVRGQYVIGFYPEEPDGRWHSLKVSVKGQKEKRLKVSGRKGYLSPKKS